MSVTASLNLTPTDFRDLAIGISGGLIVLALVGLWGIVRKVGVAGLLHLRRSSALADLKRAENLPAGAINNLALLAHLQIDAMVWFAAIAAVSVLAASAIISLDEPARASGLRVLAGFVGGSLGASSLFIARRSSMILYAIVNRDAYISKLRAKAGLPAKPPTSLPTGDRP